MPDKVDFYPELSWTQAKSVTWQQWTSAESINLRLPNLSGITFLIEKNSTLPEKVVRINRLFCSEDGLWLTIQNLAESSDETLRPSISRAL